MAIWPNERMYRHATFVCPDLNLNSVLRMSDGKALYHDALYHLGIGVADADHRARAVGAAIEKPPRTTAKGTPLHELWLEGADRT